MNLHQKQLLHADLMLSFLVTLHKRGYQHKNGEYKRGDAQAKYNAEHGLGIEDSLHKKLLAADIELYLGGEWLTEAEDYKEAAELWVSLHPLCRAGYYFKKPDVFHFSITHNGVE